jgi:hypothetical protein
MSKRPPSLDGIRSVGDDISALLVGVIVLAIVAVVAASTGTASFIQSAGKLLAAMAAIIVSPTPGAGK